MTNREVMAIYWHLYMTARRFGPNVECYFLDRFCEEADALIAEPEVMVVGPEIERDNFRRLKAS
jgi:hypothetical protein